MPQLFKLQPRWVSEGVKAHDALFSVRNNDTSGSAPAAFLLPNHADSNRDGMKENWPAEPVGQASMKLLWRNERGGGIAQGRASGRGGRGLGLFRENKLLL